MSVIGCQPPPYHAQGRALCLANIRRDCAKLMIIVSEMGGDERAVAMEALDHIQDTLRTVERLSGERKEPAKRQPIKVYTCSACGRLFEWGPHSYWFGNLKDLDAGRYDAIRFACSAGCRDAVV